MAESNWLTINSDLTNDTIGASPTVNDTGETRLEVIKVTNYDGLKKLVAFEQLTGDPTYKIYVANPSNYYDGNPNNITCTITNSESLSLNYTPSTSNKFNDDDYNSGVLYQDGTSENISIQTTYDANDIEYYPDGDYYVVNLYREWDNGKIFGVDDEVYRDQGGTGYDSRPYTTTVYDIHLQFVGLKDPNPPTIIFDNGTIRKEITDYYENKNFPEIIGPNALDKNYYIRFSNITHNANYPSNVECAPEGFTFIGRSYATGTDAHSVDLESIVVSDNWINVTLGNVEYVGFRTGSVRARKVTISFDSNNTGVDRVGYIDFFKKINSSLNLVYVARFYVKLLANSSDLLNLKIGAHEDETLDPTRELFTVMASPYFQKNLLDVNIFIRGQRSFAQDSNNYIEQSDISIEDSNGNDVGFDYVDDYKAQEGCIDTPYMIRLIVHNPTTDLKLYIGTTGYWAYPFTLKCDGGVVCPISSGEILPRASRKGSTFSITPVLRTYNNVNIFKLDEDKIEAYVEYQGEKFQANCEINNGTITVTHPDKNSGLILNIRTTIDEDAYEEAKPYPGPFNPDDTPEGDPWG